MKPDLTQSDFSPGLDLDLCDTDNWLPTWQEESFTGDFT